jgi:hypothetical protein
MSHQIKVEDIEDYEFEHQIASQCGKGANKELKAVVRDGSVKYEVYSRKELICETGFILIAVAAYNDAV